MTVNGVTTDYAYEGTMLVQEFQTNAQTGQLAATATYMPGPSGPICRINESNQTEGYYPAGVSSNAPLARGVTRWYVYDGLGSKIAELDDNNNMTTSGQYDVYGLPRVGTQQGVAASSSQDYVGTLGHVTDQSTGGLIYMQARYYDPSLGRFVSQDPGYNGANWYLYAEGNPTCRVDSNGKDSYPYDMNQTQWEAYVNDVLIGGGLALLLTGVGMAVTGYCMYLGGGAWKSGQAKAANAITGTALMCAGAAMVIAGGSMLACGFWALGMTPDELADDSSMLGAFQEQIADDFQTASQLSAVL